MSDQKINNGDFKFKWLGDKVECYNPGLRRHGYIFYRSCMFNQQKYTVGDFAIVSKSGRIKNRRICRILSMYESHKEWNKETKFRGTVRWYTWARDLVVTYCLPDKQIDKENEVVEDLRAYDTFISLESLEKKCYVIFATEDDPVFLIQKNNLDKEVNFSCRYKMCEGFLLPVFSDLEDLKFITEFSEVQSTPNTKIQSPPKLSPSKYHKQKRKVDKESAMNTSDNSDCDLKIDKVKSPVNPVKNVKLLLSDVKVCLQNTPISTPNRKVTFKRNLNESFNTVNESFRILNESCSSAATSQSSTPIVNYSIVEISSDFEEPVKLKLRMSENQTNPKVLLTRLQNKMQSFPPEKRLNSNVEIKASDNFNGNKDLGIRQPRSATIDAVNLTPARRYRDLERVPCTTYTSLNLTTAKRTREKSTDNELTVLNLLNTNLDKTPARRITRSISCNPDIDTCSPDIFKQNVNISENCHNNEHSFGAKVQGRQEVKNSKVNSRRSGRNVKKNLRYFDSSDAYSPDEKDNRYVRNSILNSDHIDDSDKGTMKQNNKLKVDCDSTDELSLGEIQKVKLGSQNNNQNGENSDDFLKSRPKRRLTKPRKYHDSSDDHSPRKIQKTKERISNSKFSNESSNSSNSDFESPRIKPRKETVRNRETPRKLICKVEKLKIQSSKTNSTPTKSPRKNCEQSDEITPRKLICNIARLKICSPHSDTIVKLVTPKKSKSNVADCTPDTSKTPKLSRTPRRNICTPTPKSILKNTPSARAKLLREGVLTPSVEARRTPVKCDTTPLNKARTQLHVSYVPTALPCREKEFSGIFNFLEGKLLDGCGGCMYISGVPGTGKTATVTEVIKKLETLVKCGDVPEFQYANLNGMKLSEPRQSYVEILKQLTGKTLPWEQAQSSLDAKFTKAGQRSLPVMLVVDELDILCTKRQDVVYNLLDWPTRASAQLIVITIANTMDLPERLLMGKVTSRLGLTRLTFQAYTHKQLQEIVIKRLTGTNAFNPDAVQLVARKVASVSGDARRALDICRRAAEIAELEDKNCLVTMTHVNEALNAMITQPKVRAIRHCSRLQQLILQSVVAEVERTGVDETTFSEVYKMLVSVATIEGFQMVSCTVALGAVSKLGACRLLLVDQKTFDISQKLILNVSSDDVYYALRKD